VLETKSGTMAPLWIIVLLLVLYCNSCSKEAQSEYLKQEIEEMGIPVPEPYEKITTMQLDPGIQYMIHLKKSESFIYPKILVFFNERMKSSGWNWPEETGDMVEKYITIPAPFLSAIMMENQEYEVTVLFAPLVMDSQKGKVTQVLIILIPRSSEEGKKKHPNK